jgi:hypothetical protein
MINTHCCGGCERHSNCNDFVNEDTNLTLAFGEKEDSDKLTRSVFFCVF